LPTPGGAIPLEAAYRVSVSPERDLSRRTGKPSPREKSWRGVTSDYERAYLALAGPGWRVQGGRDYLWWGPGGGEGLILSSRAGSLDHLAADISIGRLTLRAIHGVLDPRLPRRLAGHRLELRLPRGIRAGLSETVLYTGRGVDWAYLLPLSWFYANQYNESDDDNILWSLDLSVPAVRGLILSGELLIDDYQYDSDPSAPDKVALSVAADLLVQPWGRELMLRAGFTRIDMYTYTHKDSLRTAYLTGTGDPAVDAIIGDQLGPDADRWTASLRTPLHPRAVASLEWTRARRGEGNDMRPWDWTGDPDPSLPSGAEERETVVTVALDIDLGGGSAAGAGGGWRLRSGDGGERTDAFAWISLLWDF
ncbi:MAG: capsule assembly Wzi family protein, partial [Candidatus Krumholzibacteria bacterium]|nr:capsule assembly Wzi family protein [Candidatus Krumholzibacteria bacterium]